MKREGTMTLKPWRQIAEPHEDVRSGTFVQAEFAADLYRVHTGTAVIEYQDPAQRTFITEGMRLLLESVIKRLSGKGGDPVIQLQTAFGGGKTHTMLAVYHLAQGKAPASEMPGISSVLDKVGVSELPQARIAVLDGNKAAPNQPVSHGAIRVHTLWGSGLAARRRGWLCVGCGSGSVWHFSRQGRAGTAAEAVCALRDPD